MSSVLDELAYELEPDASVLSFGLRAELEPPIVLGLDIGTSGVRAMLFDGRGEEIEGSHTNLSSELYATLHSGADTGADDLVEHAARTLDILLARTSDKVSRIDYVGTSCAWHSLVGVNREGLAVTPVFGWADTRAARAARELRDRFDERQTHARTGCRFHPSYWPAKLSWLRDERGDLFEQADRWLGFAEYFALRLFGEASVSVSMASGTGLLDQRSCAWDGELLEALGITTAQLPAIAQPGKTFTKLTDAYALRWPMLNRAAWFPAIGDGATNNVGAGCATRERAALMIGTSGAMRVLFAGEPPESLPPELFCYRADRDRVVVGGALSDGGGLYRWLTEALMLNEDEEEIERALAAIEPDSHGLTILPFWSGERSTGWSTTARGAILGLESRTQPIEILRAAMEAVAYRFALIARALDTIAPDASIIAAGNALLASPVWAHILADVLARPIKLSAVREASCCGVALLALEAAGKIENIEELPAAFDQVYEPETASHERYRAAIERQQQIYQQLNSHRGTESFSI